MLRWVIVLVCLVAAPEAAADSLTLGQQHFRAGLYERAYELWLPSAEKGDRHAQYSIGVMHERGLAVDKDPVEAARWYALSAGQGYEPALTALRALAPGLIDKSSARKAMGRDDDDWLPPVPKLKPPQRPFHVGMPPIPALRVAAAATATR